MGQERLTFLHDVEWIGSLVLMFTPKCFARLKKRELMDTQKKIHQTMESKMKGQWMELLYVAMNKRDSDGQA